MKRLIKRFIYLFLNEKQVYKARMIFMKRISLKKDIITSYSLNSFGDNSSDSFFGYYDISPFKGNKLIYLRKRKDLDKVDIISRDLVENSETVLDSSTAWNWQQGSRLRWLPNTDNKIIFNDYDNSKYVSNIINVLTGEKEVLEWPLYDIDSSGGIGITLNFSRLGVMRPGYGYTNDSYEESKNLDNEGIGIVDIKNKTYKKVITYSMITRLLGLNDAQLSKSYINHLSFSPSGKKFIFFWIEIKENKIHQASLLVYDLVKSELKVLEKELSVSHYVWVNDESIIVTAYDLQRNCRYYLYHMDGTKEAILPEILKTDGHPTWLGNGKMITDTYPDKHGYQKILYIDIERNKVDVLIDIYSTYKCYGERRCDLHPRVNQENGSICFDANVKGHRKLYVLKGWN